MALGHCRRKYWLSRNLDWHGVLSFSPEARGLARDFKSLLKSATGSPWFLRAGTIYQTVKQGWSPCHPQTVVAKGEKAKAACSVKHSGSSHHTPEGGQIWQCPTIQSQLAASKQGVYVSLPPCGQFCSVQHCHRRAWRGSCVLPGSGHRSMPTQSSSQYLGEC